MGAIPLLSENQITRLAEILCDAGTHEELSAWFSRLNIAEELPLPSKYNRLKRGLSKKQRADGCANNVLQHVLWVLEPVRFLRNPERQVELRTSVNEALLFSGLQVDERNQIIAVARAYTVDEARERAGTLRTELARRGVHSEVLRFCREELLDENYFHAVLEAAKSVFERIRTMTGLTGDGAALVEEAFSLKSAMLAINSLRTETEQSEHTGFANLLKGVAGHLRNPPAHGPKITRPQVTEQDALDLMTLLSYLHRRLDGAVVLRSASQKTEDMTKHSTT